MTKKAIAFITAVIVIFIALIFIVGKFPPPSAEETGGTIGKVQKYRKIQMSEKDIILRSELVKDTSKLSRSIYGLAAFNSFAKEYSADLKSIAADMEQNNYSKDQAGKVAEYSKFIEENRKSVENMVALLTDFYTGDTTDYSIDVEKKLLDFNNFVEQINVKDSMIVAVLQSMEKTVKTNKTKKDEELKNLQNIHDKLLLKGMVFAVSIGSSEQVSACSQLMLFNTTNLGFVIGSKPLEASVLKKEVQNNSALNCLFNGSELKYVAGIELENILSKQTLALLNKPSLQVILNTQLGMVSVQQFGLGIASQVNTMGVVYFNTMNGIEIENIISSALSQTVMQKVVNSSVLEGALM